MARENPAPPPEDELQPQPRREDPPAAPFEGPTDEATLSLVERAQGGDSDALNRLFERYTGFMVEMARRRMGARLRGKEEAEDLAQTTFREAARDFGGYEYRGEGSLLRWLLQILRNKIRDRAEYYSAGKRDVAKERTIEELAPNDDRPLRLDLPTDDLSVTRQVSRNEEFAILRDALDELTPDHRKAITLVFFQGKTLREAGEQMGGRSEDAVRMLLRRAEKRLRELTKARLK